MATIEKASDTEIKITEAQADKVSIKKYAILKQQISYYEAKLAELYAQLSQADALGVVEVVVVKK